MADRYRRKRVRTMRRVLREHGSPVPRKGCLGTLMVVVLFVVSVVLTVAGALAMRVR